MDVAWAGQVQQQMVPVHQEKATFFSTVTDAIHHLFGATNPVVAVIFIIGVVVVLCFFIWMRSKKKK